jgi:hypothetical protein
MKWYKITEKSPKHNSEILGLHFSGQMHILRFIENTVHCWASMERHGMFVSDITHWQRLPALPKDK